METVGVFGGGIAGVIILVLIIVVAVFGFLMPLFVFGIWRQSKDTNSILGAINKELQTQNDNIVRVGRILSGSLPNIMNTINKIESKQPKMEDN